MHMASTGAKAALLDTSLKRIDALLKEFAEATGIEPAKLPEHNRDAELLTAYRLEAIANWLEVVVQRTRVFSGLAKSVTDEGDLKDAPDGSEPVTGVDVTPDGVIIAETPDGAVTSDGQDTPAAVKDFGDSEEYKELMRQKEQELDAAGEDTKKLNQVSAKFTKKVREAQEKWQASNGDADR
jgi:hypothetical protein